MLPKFFRIAEELVENFSVISMKNFVFLISSLSQSLLRLFDSPLMWSGSQFSSVLNSNSLSLRMTIDVDTAKDWATAVRDSFSISFWAIFVWRWLWFGSFSWLERSQRQLFSRTLDNGDTFLQFYRSINTLSVRGEDMFLNCFTNDRREPNLLFNELQL